MTLGKILRHETILAVLVVLTLAFLAGRSDKFATLDNLLNQGRLMAEVGLVAMTMTFVIITGGIDLSVGSIIGLVAILLGVFWQNLGLPLPVAIVLAMAVGTLGGVANGWIITRFRVPPLIATLATLALYRGLAEGFTSHMWDWYTGFIIWKTQNPWTAMRGQMYDYYLDPNACLYGLHNGSAPLHIMYNPVNGMVMAANNTFKPRRSMMLVVKTYDMAGKDSLITQVFVDIGATTTKRYFSIKKTIDEMAAKEGVFLLLQLLDTDKKLITDNLYWIADQQGNYSGLQKLKQNDLTVKAKYIQNGKIEVTLDNKQPGALAFFNRLSLVDADTKTRLLPIFYSDNYVTVLPGEKKKVIIDYAPAPGKKDMQIEISGWNINKKYVPIDNK